MKKILLSFKPFWAEKIKNGDKIFEYRKRFCDEPVIAYMYVSRPVMAVTGIIVLDKRIELEDLKVEYQNNTEIYERICEYSQRNKFVMPIMKFIPTNSVSLKEIQKKLPGFIAPQMYYNLCNNNDLLKLLEQKIKVNGAIIVNSIEEKFDNEICKNIT